MSAAVKNTPAAHREAVVYLIMFLGAALFNLCATRVGWESRNLPGVEFRQAQTAISSYYIQKEHNFSLAYPTPVLGKPWSIPLEFPLYQWTVVGLSNATGLDLTKAGRLVSQACFYLCLPAIFLLLGQMRVEAGLRWLVLALVVTCPLYIFYSRAFLMETMALMFSLWFWVAFEKTITGRDWRWLVLAMIAGSGAGLVKVTTFMLYLLPAGWWAVRRLWEGTRDRRWRGDFVWMALAVAVPFALTLWWLRFADATKALNPSAQFIREGNVGHFTWGTLASHFSPELWREKWRIVAEQLSWAPLLGAGVLLALLGARHRGREMLQLLVWFGAVLFIFPVLYARHDYYFVANGVLLLMALGLVLVGLAESKRPTWVVMLAVLTFVGGHIAQYHQGFFQSQKGITEGGDGLSHTLRGLTEPNEVVVITGQDWNSMTPYYAQRRALMIREISEENATQMEAAFAALAGEKIGALVLAPATKGRKELLERAVGLGIDPQPVVFWRGFAVHFPLARREACVLKIVDAGYDGLTWGPAVVLPRNPLAGAWLETANLQPRQLALFRGMRPKPVKFFSTYGPVMEENSQRPNFGAHPVTRLVFRLAPGAHTLMTSAVFSPGAYDESLAEDARTDGIEITIGTAGYESDRPVFFSRLIDPSGRTEDRGVQSIRVSFLLEDETDVEVFIGPGPQGHDNHDWVWLGPLLIK